MLANHDRVDSLRIDKVEESKAARTARHIVAHDGAVSHLAKLRKVSSERVYPVQVQSVFNQSEGVRKSQSNFHAEPASCGLAAFGDRYLPSVVSQFRPPTNIFLFQRQGDVVT